ncbi:hypothetical protein ASZ90_016108 [hydrocarbon metagenome]|uniref:Uncharacterized protein n=1 Tax=hydrocarbon metagenome TaxID=938273 RepID=A0A0W8F048_9ZZZZ
MRRFIKPDLPFLPVIGNLISDDPGREGVHETLGEMYIR